MREGIHGQQVNFDLEKDVAVKFKPRLISE